MLPPTPRYRQLSINDAIQDLTVPFAFGQMEVIRSADGTPLAAVTWAWLSDTSIARLEADPGARLHISELTEGRSPCISGVYPSGSRHAVRAFLQAQFGAFPTLRTVPSFSAPASQFRTWDQAGLEHLLTWLYAN